MKSKEVLKKLRVTRATLSRYVSQGKIRVKRLPNGYYEYDDNDVYKMMGLKHKRKSVIYARASTQKKKKKKKKKK